jgi:hypothetical protein
MRSEISNSATLARIEKQNDQILQFNLMRKPEE